MDADRAKEILNSKGVIEVVHNGAPVWIEGLRGSNADVMVNNKPYNIKKTIDIPLPVTCESIIPIMIPNTTATPKSIIRGFPDNFFILRPPLSIIFLYCNYFFILY